MSTVGKGESSAKTRWKKASFFAGHATQFSSRFRTLRDMVSDAFIDFDTLTLEKKLGEGAYATVHLATLEGRTVAVKILKIHFLNSEKDLDEFFSEAALLNKLKHPAVIDFIGISVEMASVAIERKLKKTQSWAKRTSLSLKSRLRMKIARQSLEDASPSGNLLIDPPIGDKTPETSSCDQMKNVVLVQEFMSRGTLKSLVLEQMTHPFKLLYSRARALEWLIQIAQGLKYLHEAKPKIIHRDVKLDNLMLTRNAEGRIVAKIGDFGLHAVLKEPVHNFEHLSEEISDAVISSLTSNSKEQNRAAKASYTLSGKTGSYMYMAPEVLRSQPYNEKADVFSFALIMYELFNKQVMLCFASCTGRPDEIEKYAERVASGSRPLVPSEWPDELKTLIRDAWKHSYYDRPSMDVIIDRLKSLKNLDWIVADQQTHGIRCCFHH